MKALELLNDYKNIDFMCNMDELHNEIDEAIAELETLQKRIDDINDLKRVQSDSLIDDYMIGLYNGLELASCTLDNRDPIFINTGASNE